MTILDIVASAGCFLVFLWLVWMWYKYRARFWRRLLEILPEIGIFVGFTIFLLWVMVPIHEGFHWLACKILGGDGTIHILYRQWGGFAGYLSPTELPSFPSQDLALKIVYFSGGLGTALFFFLPLLIIAWKRKCDLCYKLAFLIPFLIQFGYGIWEGLCF